jgi:peptide/nickel transport system substrate-binding protein
MLNKKGLWLISLMLLFALVLGACGTSTPTEEAAPPAEEEAPPAEEEAPPADGDACPALTIADRMGVAASVFERIYELADYEAAAGCTMTFSENPDIAALNSQITNNPDLPPLEERLPAEPLVVVPYDSIGQYGGVFNALSNATESGTSDFLAVRHVNLVRYGDDYITIEPYVAKGWEWNDDFTEVTLFLREGQKWSDGAPFTTADVEFWLNELIKNPDVIPNIPSWAFFGGEPMNVEVIDDTTIKFTFAAPTPGFMSFMATSYIQPWQPKHFFEKKMEEGMTLPEVAELYYGNSDWTDTPSPLLSGEADDVIPTLEAHILVEETTEGRHLVANPYFFAVDTTGNQLPYINEQDELYIPDSEVRNLKITNGEVDYKAQSLSIIDFPLYKENEEQGDYTVDLANTVGEMVFYAFNLNYPDDGLREIFNDLRFRQAISLSMNREEIVELVFLGQAEPMQATPADPNTVNFVTEEHKTAFIEYDPDGANALLDEMGLLDQDGDGFRDRFDGSNLTLDLQYATQGGPAALHELVSDYWEDIGIASRVKEVTSDEYRDRANTNNADVLTWHFDSTGGAYIVIGTEMLLPPFGEPFNPGIAYLWEEWVTSEGASGVEPPDDVKQLYDIVAEWQTYPLGSPENSELGEQFVDIHVNNLWKIGTAGNLKAPIIHTNRLKNFGPYAVMSYDYYRSYPLIPAQWYFGE